MANLKGRTALITGSTSGIGLGVAKTLAGAGANIMLHGFGDGETIRSSLEKEFGVKVWYNGADLAQSDGVRALVRETISKAGSLEILVNNAGIQHTAPIVDYSQEIWDKIIALMLTAPYIAIQEALPSMRKSGWGRIINVSSVHGLVASVNKCGYVAAKHGLAGLTKVVGLETAREPITCNAICPGWVLTPLVQKQIDDIAAKENISNDAAREKLLSAKQPSVEFAKPEEIGQLALFLCGDAARQMTGATYTMDGGWTAQ